MARAVSRPRKALFTVIGWTIGFLIFFPILWTVLATTILSRRVPDPHIRGVRPGAWWTGTSGDQSRVPRGLYSRPSVDPNTLHPCGVSNSRIIRTDAPPPCCACRTR